MPISAFKKNLSAGGGASPVVRPDGGGHSRIPSGSATGLQCHRRHRHCWVLWWIRTSQRHNLSVQSGKVSFLLQESSNAYRRWRSPS